MNASQAIEILDIARARNWQLWFVFWCLGIPIKISAVLYNHFVFEVDTYGILYLPVATLALWWCWCLVRSHMNVAFKPFGYVALFIAAASAHNVITSLF